MELGSWIAVAALILTVGHTSLTVLNYRRVNWKEALDQCLKDLERCEESTVRVREDYAWLLERARSAAPTRHGRPDPA